MSTCLMKQNSALLNKMKKTKKTKKKDKQITFKSTSRAHKHVLVNLPSGYRKTKLPGLKAWVDALNSGKYRQGNSHLCMKDRGRFTYCCLGVLSKVQGRLVSAGNCNTEKGDGTIGADGTVDDYSVCYLHTSNPLYSIIGDNGVLPNGVWVNTFDKRTVDYDGTPEFDHSDAITLVSLNDDLSLSFKDIAKVLQLLFKP